MGLIIFTSGIAKHVVEETKSMTKIKFIDFLPKIFLPYLLWLYRMSTDQIEKERFDKKSILELTKHCEKINLKTKTYPGGILQIG